MKFKKFQINKFRGISKATLDLSKTPDGSINVLVGLNESGKTTILEAINHFRSNPDLKKINPNTQTRSNEDYQAMIPIAQRALFNSEISISASLELDSQDIINFERYLKETFKFAEVNFNKSFTIYHKIGFKDSQRERINNTWSLEIKGRKRKGSTPFKELKGDDWLNAVKYVEKNLLPKVMYFPAALLDFPDSIPLEKTILNKDDELETVPNRDNFYYEVLTDVLKATNPKFNIETHLIERAKSDSKIDKQNLDSVIQQTEEQLNKTILGAWKEILNTDLKEKRFRLSISKDENDLICAEIKLWDGNGIFSLKERSAGFRWFFAFIMLVSYRTNRNDKVLFLFDEPAANLHPRAQSKLLNSFTKLSHLHQFIYTTHSHYLVNPLWLESTFVIKNESLSDDFNDLDDILNNSGISITPYKKFVGTHPNQTFYYRPVMDALEYSPSKLQPGSCSVLIEGKSDYYCLEFFARKIYPEGFNITLFPGGGSGSLDPLISILCGWHVEFMIILDGDQAGESESERYHNKFESLVSDKVTTLSRLISSNKNTKVEDLIEECDKEKIRQNIFPEEKKLTKKLLHRGMQLLLINDHGISFDAKTIANFSTILQSIKTKLTPP